MDVVWAGDIIDQRLVANETEKLAIEAATRWDYSDDIILRACVSAGKSALDCDTICQIGAGMRTSYVVESVENETGKPLVATDISMFWSIMKAGGLTTNAKYASLLGTL